jgi:5-methylthioadenosine/S-adenosylhomocysteine deaminase
MSDLLVLDGIVVTMDKDRSRIKDGAVLIDENRIVRIGKSEELRKEGADKIIRANGGMILPGFVDSHTHAQSTITSLKGFGLEAPGSGLYKRLMTIRVFVPEKQRYFLAMGGCLTALRSGITTIADWDFGENEVAKVVRDIGLRGLLSEYTYGIDFHKTREMGHHVFSEEEADRTFNLALKFIEDWHGKANGRITCSLGPHAPDTCPPEFLSKIREEANKRDLLINTHLAQSDDEVAYVQKLYGKTPTEYLNDEKMLGEKTVVAHCVKIGDVGIDILAKTKTNITICPHIYARRGGTTAMMKFIDAGCNVGLGTDGSMDMVRFMDNGRMAVAFRNNCFGENYEIPSAYKMIEMATINSAKVIGMDKEIGSLEPGKKADIIIVDSMKSHMVPNVDPVTNLVYYGNLNDIKTVIVDGIPVMEEYEIKTINEFNMLEKVQTAARKTWNRFYEDEKDMQIH